MDSIKNNDALSSAGIAQTIDIDLTTISGSEDTLLPHDLLGYKVISVQVVWKDLTGTFDGNAEIIQSNNGSDFDRTSISTQLTSTNGSNTLYDNVFNGRYVGVRLNRGSIVTGTVQLIFILKV